MKKLSIILAGMVAVLGMTSCEADKDPVYQQPAEGSFKLNEPALANQLIELTPENSVILTCSQPDYGFTASVTYSAEMKIDGNDEVYALKSETPTSAMIRLSGEEIATGMCVLRGIDSEEAWTEVDPMPVYFRAVAQIGNFEDTRIVSNWVSYNLVKGYFAIPTPGYIYLVGSPNGWTEPTEGNAANLAKWRLLEATNQIGSQIYSGVFDIPAGDEFRFRLYTALTGWDKDSWGPNEDAGVDKEEDYGAYNVIFDWDEESEFATSFEKSKNNFTFRPWVGGTVTITADFSGAKPKLTIVPGAQAPADYIYMIGNNSGWAAPEEANKELYANWRLADKTESGIYTAKFAITASMTDTNSGNIYCRFFKEFVKSGWEGFKAEWASSPGDNVDVVYGSPMPTVAGDGCFVIMGAVGHNLTITIDTNTNQATFNLD